MTYSGGDFSPVEAVNPLDQMRSDFQTWEEGNAPVEEQAESDLQRKTILEGEKYNDLIAFTDKLKPILEEQAQKYIDRKQAINLDDEFLKYKEKIEKGDDEDIAKAVEVTNVKEDSANKQEIDNRKIVKEISKQDYFASREFKKLSPYSQNAMIVQWTNRQLMVHANTLPDLTGYEDQTKVAGVMSAHRQKTFGNIAKIFPNADKGFLEKYVYRPIRNREQLAVTAWTVHRKNEDRKNDQAIEFSQLADLIKSTENQKEGDYNINKIVEDFAKRNVSNYDDSLSASRRAAWNYLIDNPDLYKLEDVRLIGKEIIEHTGRRDKTGAFQKVPFSEGRKDIYKRLVKAKLDAIKAESDELAQIASEQGNEIVNNIKDSYNNPNFKPQDANGKDIKYVDWLKEQQKAFKSATGKDSEWIKQKIHENSPNNQLLQADEENLIALKQNRAIGMRDLEGLPFSLVKKYQEEAKYNDANRNALSGYRTEIYEQLANRHTNPKVDSDNQSVISMGNAYYKRFETKVLLRTMTEGEEHRDKIIAEESSRIAKEINKIQLNKGMTTEGYDVNQLSDFFRTGQKSANDFVGEHWIKAKYRSDMDLLNGQLASLQHNALTTTFKDGSTIVGDAEAIEAMSEGYGSGSWVPNAKLQYLARHYNTDTSTVLNSLRRAVGLKPVKSSYADAAIQSIQDMDQKQLLAKFPNNADIKARALWTVHDPTPGEPNSGDEFIKPLIPQFNETQEAVNLLSIDVDKGSKKPELNDTDIAMISVVNSMVNKEGYSREEILTAGSEANKEFLKRSLEFCVDVDIKNAILQQFMATEALPENVNVDEIENNKLIQQRSELENLINQPA